MSQLIYSINEVSADLHGLELTIKAKGQTNTSPWVNPKLVFKGIADNGVYEYNFCATEIGTKPVFDDISVEQTFFLIPILPPMVRVRIYSQTNCMTVNTCQPILKVEEVAARFDGYTLFVKADGLTSSTGWTNPELYFKGVTDNVFEYDFCAVSPMVGGDALTEINANIEQPILPPFPEVIKVRVNGEMNSIVVNSSKLISKVEKVTGTLTGNLLEVIADGTVPTTGWTKPELVLESKESDDPIKFGFYALPPNGFVHPTITPISANVERPLTPSYPTKIDVRSETNSITEFIAIPKKEK